MSAELTSQPIDVTVEAPAHGWRLDHYLARMFPNYSRGLFQRAIEQSVVLVNGLSVKASRRLRVNDRLSIRLPEEPDSSLRPENIPLTILYEDEALAVINKPADMVTHPGKGNFTGTLAAAVQFHFDKLSDVAGQLRPGIVHRLDRDTTGVIIVAKDNHVHQKLSRQFEQREVKKEYRAIVRGQLPRDADYVRTHIRTHPKQHDKMITCGPEDNAREAVTFYEVLERFRGFTSVRLLPETGRTHQLRVHMTHLRCPILADKLYGGHDSLKLSEFASDSYIPSDTSSLLKKGSDPFEQASIAKGSQSPESVRPLFQQAALPVENDILIHRQALHAHSIEYRHPLTDQPMRHEAPLPDDMCRALSAIETYRRT